MNKKILLLFACLASVLTASSQQSSLLPKADDAFWRDSIPMEMRQSSIEYGEQYLGHSWTVLPWTVFAENKINGNRVNYEKICFEKRRQLVVTDAHGCIVWLVGLRTDHRFAVTPATREVITISYKAE